MKYRFAPLAPALAPALAQVHAGVPDQDRHRDQSSSSPRLPEGKPWNADDHCVLPATQGFGVLNKPISPDKLPAFRNDLRKSFRQIRAEIARAPASYRFDSEPQERRAK